MRFKRPLTLLLVLCLAVTGLALPAAAVEYTDTKGHWAEIYINDVSERGIFNGYENNTFRPYNNLTAAEALVVCGRVCNVSSSHATFIEARWEDTLDSILGTSYSWARKELAICLETGVLTVEELRSLQTTAALGREMKKEDLAMYFVRAMGLTELAAGLTNYDLSFSDTASITPSRRPYVYILSLYGIVEGDTQNNFSPQLAVNRGVVATMLSRVVNFMAEQGIVTELPEYTTYEWLAGTITSVTSGSRGSSVVRLKSDVSGTQSVTVPATAQVYRYNMRSDASALQNGLYARMALNNAGTVSSVRLFGSLQTLTGTVTDLERNSIAVNTGAETRTLTISRLTEVSTGRNTGDRSIIDLDGDYTTATCTLDASGGLLALQLSGGTYLEEGLVAGVDVTTSKTTLSVTGYDGVTRRYEIGGDAAVVIDGVSRTLNSSYKGDFVSLRLSGDTDEVVSVDIDTDTDYVQGGVRSVNLNRDPEQISVTDPSTRRSSTYKMASSVSVTYEGEEAVLKDIRTSWFVTMRRDSKGNVVEIIGYPGSIVTEGSLTNITYGSTIVLEVTDADGVVTTFDIPVTDLPEFERGGKESSFDKLRLGDSVRVTVRYNEVTLVESDAQETNLKGTITRIVQESAGSTIEVALEDGTTASYLVTSAVSITADDKAVAISTLKVGYKLSLLVSGDQLLAIEVDSASSADRVSGTVLFVNLDEETILLQTGDSSVITVSVDSGTQLVAVTGGTFTLRSLYEDAGEAQIEVYGQYNGLTFDADVILLK